jgi:iron complex outermembrane receptor protein
LVLGTGFTAMGTAQAQQQVNEAPADTGKVEEVVVTGSLIKRTDFETPSPVQVITAADLTQSGFTSVKDVLNNLSANGQGNLSQSFPQAFAGGGSGIALRGLTVGATLTLVDSARMVGYPLTDDAERNFVDVSAIPLVAVDHVDVVKDGASAAYGSDAIAGVVNVVLKRTYKGIEFSGEGGMTSHSDGITERVTGMAGIGDLASDGYNAYLAVEWRHQNPIDAFARKGAWNALNGISEGGINTTPGAGSVYTMVGATPFPAGSGMYLVPAGATSYQSPGVIFQTAQCPSAAAVAADNCTYLPNEQLQPRTQNLNVIGRITKSLGSDWQAVLTTSLFESQAQQVLNIPRINPSGTPFNSLTFPVYGPGFSGTSKFFPISETINGTKYFPVGRLFEVGDEDTNFSTDTYRVFLDFKGPLAGWDVDVNVGDMYALTTQTYIGFVNYNALQTAINNGYKLGSGGSAVSSFSSPFSSLMSNSLQVADVRGTRELFALPGGPLQLALGVGYYHSYLNATQSQTATSGAYDLNLAYAKGGQTDYNAYGEIVAPILSNLEADLSARYDHYNLAGGAAVPKLGLKWTPLRQVTLRGTWGEGFRAPNPAEAGNAASAFLFNRAADVSLCPSAALQPGATVNAYGLTAVQAHPMAGDVPAFCNFAPVYANGTNPALKPEKSTNWTAGFVLKPVEQVNLSMDYWSIKVKDLVLTNALFPVLPVPPAPVTNIRSGPQTLATLQSDGVTLANQTFAQGVPVFSETGYVNAGQIVVNGLDLDLLTHFDLGRYGRLSAQLNWSHEFKWEASSCYGGSCATIELAGTHGPSGVSGDTANPKDRAVFTLSWDRGPVDVTWTVNYVGGYSLNDPSLGEMSCADAVNDYSGKYILGTYPTQYCHVPHFTYVNLFGSYMITPSIQVFGSVVNLFNTAPPVDMVTYGAGLLSYNASLEQAGAVGTLYNVGFKVKF